MDDSEVGLGLGKVLLRLRRKLYGVERTIGCIGFTISTPPVSASSTAAAAVSVEIDALFFSSITVLPAAEANEDDGEDDAYVITALILH